RTGLVQPRVTLPTANAPAVPPIPDGASVTSAVNDVPPERAAQVMSTTSPSFSKTQSERRPGSSHSCPRASRTFPVAGAVDVTALSARPGHVAAGAVRVNSTWDASAAKSLPSIVRSTFRRTKAIVTHLHSLPAHRPAYACSQ